MSDCVLVASSDAPSAVKSAADLVCDGTSDQVEINDAIDHAAALASRNSSSPASAEQRGKVCLTGGRFNLDDSVQIRTGVWLSGAGSLTELRAQSMGAANMMTLATPDAHVFRISSLWFDGNSTSGGTGDAINFDMTGSGNTGSYPGTSPDSDYWIDNLLLTKFDNDSRNGIKLWASATANNRGNQISNIQGRWFGGNAIWLTAASDCFVSNTHIGSCGGAGHRIEGGNTKLSNVKTFYSVLGFHFGAGRHVVTSLEAQDNETNVYAAAPDLAGAGWVCDNAQNDNLVIAANNMTIHGLSVFQRSGGRFATCTNGVRFASSNTGLSLLGRVAPANTTNPITGTPGTSGSYIRLSGGTSLYSVG